MSTLPETPVSTATRTVALAVSAAAIACLTAAGGLSPALLPAAVVVMALADLVAASWRARADVLRSVVLPLLLVACSAPALLTLVQAAGDPELVRDAGARLAAGALVLLPLAGAAARDHLARLLLGAVTAGLALSASEGAVQLPAWLFAAGALVLLAMLERDRARAATLGVDLRPAEASAPGRRPGASTGRRSRSPSGALHTLAGGLPVVIAAGLVTVLLTRATSLTEARPLHTGGRSATSSASSPSATGGRLSGTGAMDLRRRGELPHTEIATVSTSDDLLWRTAVLTSYRGGLWRPTSAALDDEAGGAGGAGGATAGPEVRHRTDTVTVLDGAEGVLPVPGDIDGLVPHAVARLGDGLTLSVPAGTFQVSSHTAALAGARFGPASGSGADARLTALPPMPGRVAALAQRLTAGTTSQDAVEAVVRYLRQNYRYRLDPPVPSQGEDPVDRFLFEDREGFCEQFAAAAAVLLRSVGIPVRVAVGYAGGTPVDGGRLLRGTDGHAWIEVLTPGSGWAPVDPTAGVPLAPTSSALTAWLGRPGTRAVLLAGAGLAASVLLGAVAGRLSRRRIEHGLDPLDRALAALDRRLGPRRRRRDETLREFAGRLGLEPEQQAALQVAEQARYSAVQPDANRRLDAAMALRSAARRGGR